MTNFTDLGLAETLLRAVSGEGYETPTPIQAQAIPVLMEGRDIMGIAQTGTGKTAAFVLPMLNRILQAKRNRVPKTATGLVIAPTRELASQIVGNIQTYAKFTKLNVALIVGGVRPGGQIKAMRGGVDVIVATPGRLLDHMQTGAISLERTDMVVLDEADQMMDLGFLPGIRKIMKSMPRERLTALFSATMPKEIKRLADDFLNEPTEVAVAAVSRPIERIEQSVQLVPNNQKRDVLTTILADDAVERAVVFTRTKRGADKVCGHLRDAELSVAVIHGDRSQAQRDRALKQFRNKNIKILVATDIAARGIDIDDVSHVVNFDLPEVPEAYVHRIGRTARAGRSGVAVSLCDNSERHLLRAIEKLIGAKLAGGPEEGDYGSGKGANGRGRPNGNRARKPRGGPRDGQRNGQRDGPRDGQRDGARENQGQKRRPFRDKNKVAAEAGAEAGTGFEKPANHKPRGEKAGGHKAGGQNAGGHKSASHKGGRPAQAADGGKGQQNKTRRPNNKRWQSKPKHTRPAA